MRVRLEHVSHRYGESDEAAAVQVLDDVSLDIASGDFAVLRGASGSGKSTLLNLMGAVDRATSGRVYLEDLETSALTESQLTGIRRTKLGFIFQFFNLIPTLNAFENIAFPLSLAKTPKGEIAERVGAVLEQIGLTHRARHYPNELSGGEMQRVAIGRAIVHRPSLILADEPTGNLDSVNGTAVLDLIRQVHSVAAAASPASVAAGASPATNRPTIVMATHSDRAAAYGDYVVEVIDGRVRR